LRLDVSMVLVPVSVTDPMDRPVHDLPQQSFRILEDGVEQRITSFSHEEGPVSMGLLFDSSGSMKGRIESSIEALKLIFKTVTPGDEFFLIQFSEKPKYLCGFTTDPEVIRRALGHVEAKGWTALLDAMALGANEMRRAHNRRALLVLSDGNDNNSRYSEAEVRGMILEKDVRVYGIDLMHHSRMLEHFAEETGGHVMYAASMSELPAAVEKLSQEIRSEYILGYPTDTRVKDGKYHKVAVQVSPPPGSPSLRVSWRRGYYAPVQ